MPPTLRTALLCHSASPLPLCSPRTGETFLAWVGLTFRKPQTLWQFGGSVDLEIDRFPRSPCLRMSLGFGDQAWEQRRGLSQGLWLQPRTSHAVWLEPEERENTGLQTRPFPASSRRQPPAANCLTYSSGPQGPRCTD